MGRPIHMPISRVILLVVVHLFVSSVAHAQISLNAVDFGFYTEASHDPTDQRYPTGYFSNGNETRSFFIFDVPESAAGSIAAATIEVRPYGGFSADRNETLHIYDVTTDIGSLTSGAAPASTFEDLGSGIQYGFANARIEATSAFGLQPYDSLDVPLNDSALNTLNASAGTIAFGGRMASLRGEGDGEYLFFPPLVTPASDTSVQLLLHPAGGPTVDYTTQQHPLDSQMSVELFLGNPDRGGVPIAALSDIAVEGTVQATALLDDTNTGLLQFHGANLVLEDVTDFDVSLGALGGVTLDLIGMTIDIQFDPVEVLNSAFSLDDQNFVQVAVVDGLATLRDPTGAIASVFDDFPLTADLEADPIFATEDDIAGQGVGGSADLGPGLFTDFREINLDIPAIPFRVLVDGELEVWGRFSGGIHVAVPEPSSLALGILGAIALLVLPYSRTR